MNTFLIQFYSIQIAGRVVLAGLKNSEFLYSERKNRSRKLNSTSSCCENRKSDKIVYIWQYENNYLPEVFSCKNSRNLSFIHLQQYIW